MMSIEAESARPTVKWAIVAMIVIAAGTIKLAGTLIGDFIAQRVKRPGANE